MTWLYCAEAKELRLGPDQTDIVRFHDGFAEIPLRDPMHDEKMGWIERPGHPHIEVLGEERAGQVAEDTPNGFGCPECDKVFASQRALNGHLIQHRRRA